VVWLLRKNEEKKFKNFSYFAQIFLKFFPLFDDSIYILASCQ